jgi:hypothetical protein
MNGHVNEIAGVAISGATETLDEASAQFKRSYERMRERAGMRKPERR